MHIKNRKLNKDELDLWKLVTKNDEKLKSYTNNLEEKILDKKIEPEKKKENLNSKLIEKKHYINHQDIQINKRTKAKLQRGLIRPEFKLDLHGKTLIEAKKSLYDFLNYSLNKNFRCVLVVTGKKKTLSGSKGLIRKNLPIWLKEKEIFYYILFHC